MYLLDEPLASLDRRVADYIWVEAIEKRLRDRGRLVIVATHDARMLARVDEIIVLGSDGKVVSQGKSLHFACVFINILAMLWGAFLDFSHVF